MMGINTQNQAQLGYPSNNEVLEEKKQSTSEQNINSQPQATGFGSAVFHIKSPLSTIDQQVELKSQPTISKFSQMPSNSSPNLPNELHFKKILTMVSNQGSAEIEDLADAQQMDLGDKKQSWHTDDQNQDKSDFDHIQMSKNKTQKQSIFNKALTQKDKSSSSGIHMTEGSDLRDPLDKKMDEEKKTNEQFKAEPDSEQFSDQPYMITERLSNAALSQQEPEQQQFRKQRFKVGILQSAKKLRAKSKGGFSSGSMVDSRRGRGFSIGHNRVIDEEQNEFNDDYQINQNLQTSLKSLQKDKPICSSGKEEHDGTCSELQGPNEISEIPPEELQSRHSNVQDPSLGVPQNQEQLMEMLLENSQDFQLQILDKNGQQISINLKEVHSWSLAKKIDENLKPQKKSEKDDQSELQEKNSQDQIAQQQQEQEPEQELDEEQKFKIKQQEALKNVEKRQNVLDRIQNQFKKDSIQEVDSFEIDSEQESDLGQRQSEEIKKQDKPKGYAELLSKMKCVHNIQQSEKKINQNDDISLNSSSKSDKDQNKQLNKQSRPEPAYQQLQMKLALINKTNTMKKSVSQMDKQLDCANGNIKTDLDRNNTELSKDDWNGGVQFVMSEGNPSGIYSGSKSLLSSKLKSSGSSYKVSLQLLNKSSSAQHFSSQQSDPNSAVTFNKVEQLSDKGLPNIKEVSEHGKSESQLSSQGKKDLVLANTIASNRTASFPSAQQLIESMNSEKQHSQNNSEDSKTLAAFQSGQKNNIDDIDLSSDDSDSQEEDKQLDSDARNDHQAQQAQPPTQINIAGLQALLDKQKQKKLQQIQQEQNQKLIQNNNQQIDDQDEFFSALQDSQNQQYRQRSSAIKVQNPQVQAITQSNQHAQISRLKMINQPNQTSKDFHDGNLRDLKRVYSDAYTMNFGFGSMLGQSNIHNLEDRQPSFPSQPPSPFTNHDKSNISEATMQQNERKESSIAHSSSLGQSSLLTFAAQSKVQSSNDDIDSIQNPFKGPIGGVLNRQLSAINQDSGLLQSPNFNPQGYQMNMVESQMIQKAQKKQLIDMLMQQKKEIQGLKQKIEQICKFMVRNNFAKDISSDELVQMAINQNQDFNKHLHFTFLFASPRFLDLQAYSEAYGEIDYTQEWDLLKNSLIKQKVQIVYMRAQATIAKLNEAFSQGSTTIHISAHGERSPNLEKKMGKPSFNLNDLNKKGDMLLLEDQKGMSHLLLANELHKVLEEAKKLNNQNFQKVQLVFLAACHSEEIGWAFHDAGVPHVICTKQKYKINNETQNFFTQEIYMFLFKQRMSVCQAFYTAIERLKNQNNETIRSEFEKYLIIKPKEVRDDNFYNRVKNPENGRLCGCKPIGEWNSGQAQDYDVQPLFMINPLQESIYERHVEMHEIHKLINESRIVILKSLKGMGKNLIAYKLAFEFQERKRFHYGVLIIDKRQTEKSLASLIVQKIHLSARNNEFLLMRLRNIKQRIQDSQEDVDLECLKQLMKDMEIFIVVRLHDNDHLEKDELLVKQLTEILEVTKDVRFLITCGLDERIDHINGQERVYHLSKLDQKSTVSMFFQISKKHWPGKSLCAQYKMLAKTDRQIMQMLGSRDITNMREDDCLELLKEHFFFSQIMAGYPQAIKLISGMVPQYENLQILVEDLQKTGNSQSIQAIEQTHELYPIYRGLLSSLEDLRQHYGPQPIILYMLICFMPGGISQNDFDEIKVNCEVFSKQCQFEKNVHILERRCVIKQMIKLKTDYDNYDQDLREERRYDVQTMPVPFKSKEMSKISLQLKEGITIFYRNMTILKFSKLGVIDEKMNVDEEARIEFELMKLHKKNIVNCIDFNINNEPDEDPSKSTNSNRKSNDRSKTPTKLSPSRIHKSNKVSSLTSANLQNFNKSNQKVQKSKFGGQNTSNQNSSQPQKQQISTNESSFELPNLFDVVDTQSIMEKSNYDNISQNQSYLGSASEIGSNFDFDSLDQQMQEPRNRRNTSIFRQRFTTKDEILNFRRETQIQGPGCMLASSPTKEMRFEVQEKQQQQKSLNLGFPKIHLNLTKTSPNRKLDRKSSFDKRKEDSEEGEMIGQVALLQQQKQPQTVNIKDIMAKKIAQQKQFELEKEEQFDDDIELPGLYKRESKSQQRLQYYDSGKKAKQQVDIRLEKLDPLYIKRSKSPLGSRNKNLMPRLSGQHLATKSNRSNRNENDKTYDFGNMRTPVGDYSQYTHLEHKIQIKTKACDELWSIFKFPYAADLMYFYSCDLILLKQYQEASNIINEYASGYLPENKLEWPQIYQANIYKLKALVKHLNDENFTDVQKFIKLAREKFSQYKIVHGMAICYFFEAKLMIDRIEKEQSQEGQSKFNKNSRRDDRLKLAEQLAQNAFVHYRMIDHLFGQSVSIELKLRLSKIYSIIYPEELNSNEQQQLNKEKERMEKQLKRRKIKGQSRFLWRNSDFLSIMMELSFIAMSKSYYDRLNEKFKDPDSSLKMKKKRSKDKFFRIDLVISSYLKQTGISKSPYEWRLSVQLQQRQLKTQVLKLIDQVSFKYASQRPGEKDIKTRNPFETSGLYKQDFDVEIIITWNKRTGLGSVYDQNEVKYTFHQTCMLRHSISKVKNEQIHTLLFKEEAIRKCLDSLFIKGLPESVRVFKIPSIIKQNSQDQPLDKDDPLLDENDENQQIEEKEEKESIALEKQEQQEDFIQTNIKESKDLGQARDYQQQTLYDTDNQDELCNFEIDRNRAESPFQFGANQINDEIVPKKVPFSSLMNKNLAPQIPALRKLNSPLPGNSEQLGYQASADQSRSELSWQNRERFLNINKQETGLSSDSDQVPGFYYHPPTNMIDSSNISEISQPQDLIGSSLQQYENMSQMQYQDSQIQTIPTNLEGYELSNSLQRPRHQIASTTGMLFTSKPNHAGLKEVNFRSKQVLYNKDRINNIPIQEQVTIYEKFPLKELPAEDEETEKVDEFANISEHDSLPDLAKQSESWDDDEMMESGSEEELANTMKVQQKKVPQIQIQNYIEQQDDGELNDRVSLEESSDEEEQKSIDTSKWEEQQDSFFGKIIQQKPQNEQHRDQKELKRQQQEQIKISEQVCLDLIDMPLKGDSSSMTYSSNQQVKNSDTEETQRAISNQEFRLGSISELALKKQTSTEESAQQLMMQNSETTEKLKGSHERSKSAINSKDNFDGFNSFNSKQTLKQKDKSNIIDTINELSQPTTESLKTGSDQRAISPQIQNIEQKSNDISSKIENTDDENTQQLSVPMTSDKINVFSKVNSHRSNSNSSSSKFDQKSLKDYSKRRKEINQNLYEENTQIFKQISTQSDQDQLFHGNFANFQEHHDEIAKQTLLIEQESSTDAKQSQVSFGVESEPVKASNISGSGISLFSNESAMDDCNKVMVGARKRKSKKSSYPLKNSKIASKGQTYAQSLQSVFEQPNLTDKNWESIATEDSLMGINNEEEFALQHVLYHSAKDQSQSKVSVVFEICQHKDLIHLYLLSENRNYLHNILSHVDFVEPNISQIISNRTEVKKGLDKLIITANPPVILSLFFQERTGLYAFPEKIEFLGQKKQFEVQFDSKHLNNALSVQNNKYKQQQQDVDEWQYTKSRKGAAKNYHSQDIEEIQPQDIIGDFKDSQEKGVYLEFCENEMIVYREKERNGVKIFIPEAQNQDQAQTKLFIYPGQNISEENKQIIKMLYELYSKEDDPRERNNYKQQLLSHMKAQKIRNDFIKVPQKIQQKASPPPSVPAQPETQVQKYDAPSYDSKTIVYDIKPTNVPITGQTYRQRQQELAAKFRWKSINNQFRAKLKIPQIQEIPKDIVPEMVEEDICSIDNLSEKSSYRGEGATLAKNIDFDQEMQSVPVGSKPKPKNLMKSNASLGNSSKRSKSLSETSQETPIRDKKGFKRVDSNSSFIDKITKEGKKKNHRNERKRASYLKKQDSFYQFEAEEQKLSEKVPVMKLKKERSRSLSQKGKKTDDQVLEEVKAQERWALQKLQKPKNQGITGIFNKMAKSVAKNLGFNSSQDTTNSISQSQALSKQKTQKTQAVFGSTTASIPSIPKQKPIEASSNLLKPKREKPFQSLVDQHSSGSSRASQSSGESIFTQEMTDDLRKLLRSNDKRFHKAVQKNAKWIQKDKIQVKDKLVISLGIADLTEEETDALVNPTNIFLVHRSGLSGQLLKKWPGLQVVSKKILDNTGTRSIKTGDCVVTEAGDLNMKYLLHTPGPIWKNYKDKDKPRLGVARLTECIRNCLMKARDLDDVKIVSFPPISAGNNGGNPEIVAEILFRTIFDWCYRPPSNSSGNLVEIRIRNPDTLGHRTFQEVMKELFQEASGFQDVMIEYEKQRSESSSMSEGFDIGNDDLPGYNEDKD